MNSFLSSKNRSSRARRLTSRSVFDSIQGPRPNTFRQPPSKRREPKKIWQILYSMFF